MASVLNLDDEEVFKTRILGTERWQGEGIGHRG